MVRFISADTPLTELSVLQCVNRLEDCQDSLIARAALELCRQSRCGGKLSHSVGCVYRKPYPS